MTEVTILLCFRCSNAWRPIRPEVRNCPRCKSTSWNVPRVSKRLGPATGLGIEQVVGQNRAEVMRRALKYGARHVRVFGSVRRGQAREGSDLDLLVEFDVGRDLFDQIRLERELSNLLGRRVSVVTKAGLHPLVRPQVMFEAVPL